MLVLRAYAIYLKTPLHLHQQSCSWMRLTQWVDNVVQVWAEATTNVSPLPLPTPLAPPLSSPGKGLGVGVAPKGEG